MEADEDIGITLDLDVYYETYLYDIPMKEELPQYLQYDFGVVI